MSGDLISRDELLKSIESSMRINPHKDRKIAANHNAEHMHFMGLVSRTPSAYDIDKVCRKINENKDMDNLIDADHAIKIVKGGGLNG